MAFSLSKVFLRRRFTERAAGVRIIPNVGFAPANGLFGMECIPLNVDVISARICQHEHILDITGIRAVVTVDSRVRWLSAFPMMGAFVSTAAARIMRQTVYHTAAVS